MKTLNPLGSIVVSAAALTLVCGSSYPKQNWNAPHVVTAYCSGCHGINGNSPLPYMPRVSGLSMEYCEKKLGAFKEPATPPVDELFDDLGKVMKRRVDRENVTPNERINMEGVAHAVDAELIQEAVRWYAVQPSGPGRRSDDRLTSEGKELFLHGSPTQKVLACMTCHGTYAEGKGAAPRLAGQNKQYVESQLEKFRKGDRTHAPEMTMVTRDLDAEQGHAVAAYLQSLSWPAVP